jgi:UTP--glucose-1-phosphate uridylyltransferase
MTKQVRKAVFPVAGLGTRFLPATKALPKEMLTVVDRPVIQHVADEAREAGLEHFVFVTGRGKEAIENHFDRQYELEATLRARGTKQAELDLLAKDQFDAGKTSFTRQQEPLGLGHAVWCARDIVGDEPFALLLPDMLHKAKTKSCTAQLTEAYKKNPGNYVAVYNVPREQTKNYGIVGKGKEIGSAFEITEMVEKPSPDKAPSTLAISGRYILEPAIFDILATQERGAGGEIQLTDAMLTLAKSRPFYGVTFDGEIHDCGSKLGFLLANLSYGLASKDIQGKLRGQIENLLKA